MVELCNTGLKDGRDRISVTKYFKELPLLYGISPMVLVPHRSDLSELFYRFTLQEPAERGTKIIAAEFNAMCAGFSALPEFENLLCTPVVSDEELLIIMESLAAENMCPINHLMAKTPSIDENGSCYRCKGMILVGVPCYKRCGMCNIWLCSTCSNKYAHRMSELNFLRRFYAFAAAQLNQFSAVFSEFLGMCQFFGRGQLLFAGSIPLRAYYYTKLPNAC